MAAELVETDRLRARTVAQIAPDRIESVARHLATRSHTEPWWEPERGAAMTHERVSLYGLPIVSKRRVAYDRIDRADARGMFIRHALVAGDWDAPPRFLPGNRARVVEVPPLAPRLRPHPQVTHDTPLPFLTAPPPPHLPTAPRFHHWWRHARDAP